MNDLGKEPDLTPGNVTFINRTDAQKATDYRAKLTPLLEQVAAIVQSARTEGLIVGFNISPDQFGRVRVNPIDIQKPL